MGLIRDKIRLKSIFNNVAGKEDRRDNFFGDKCNIYCF